MTVTRVLLIEGVVNVLVTLAKAYVGLYTGSMAILADALHSATDAANNVLAFFIQRISQKPADKSHPYGHRKFEYLGIFVLAVLLCVVALELTINALLSFGQPLAHSQLGLLVIIGAMLLSFAVSVFERHWAKKLQSKLLDADSKHTFIDGLTTLAAIAGWQFSLMGVTWLDPLIALSIAALVLYLAYGLFKQAIPILVDQAMVNETAIEQAAKKIPGVVDIKQVRSRSTGDGTIVEITASVAGQMTTKASHEIADKLEADLSRRFNLLDVVVHVEPTE